MIGTVVIVSILSVYPTNISPTALAQKVQHSIAPAPPSICAEVPPTYFGPAPSQVNPSFIGPLQLLRSGTVDINASTVTLPLSTRVDVISGRRGTITCPTGEQHEGTVSISSTSSPSMSGYYDIVIAKSGSSAGFLVYYGKSNGKGNG
jgi:hypothetical protein